MEQQQAWMAFWTVAIFVVGFPLYLYMAGRLTWWQVKQVYDFCAVLFGRGERSRQTKEPQKPAPTSAENLSIVTPSRSPGEPDRTPIGPARVGPAPPAAPQEPDLPF